MIGRKYYRCMHEYDITMDNLKNIKNALIIDVRNKREFEEGHIRGSINIPEYEINENICKKINKEKTIIIYCSSGHRSLDAYKKLKQYGYKNVYNLYKGLENY